MKLLIDQLNKYNADITALQEVRWVGSGTIEKKECTVYYSCGKKHEFGTGFIVNKKAKHLVIGFTPVNERMSCLRIRTRFFNCSLINIHAPTEEKSEDEKDAFYTLLEKTYDNCPGHDVKIIIGDANAQVGKENIYLPTIGKHSLHNCSNDNGQRLIDFAVSKDMVIGSTMFPHKNIHKGTWKSPDGKTVNQIDHFVIDKRHQSMLEDIRSFRGANIDSDHYLVMAKINARISNYKKEHLFGNKKLYNVDKLKSEDTLMQYRNKLTNELANKDREETEGIINVDTKWEEIKMAIVTTAEHTIGVKGKRLLKDWFDVECEKATKDKNEAYLCMLQRCSTRQSTEDYKNKRKIEKKIHKEKKRSFENELVREIEESRGKNECKRFYKMINDGRKAFKPYISACKDEEGNILTRKTKILERWVQHFRILLDKDFNNRSRMEYFVEEPILNIECLNDSREEHAPTIVEIETVIMDFKNNKAPGIDNLQTEFLKYGEESLRHSIQKLFEIIWDKEIIPTEWKMGIICPLYKKGDPMICGSYRGITLLTSTYKLFSKILYLRLLPYVENVLGSYQCGFRQGKSTIDQIFTLRQILEKTKEFKIETHHLFIDFSSAYDSIKRPQLYAAMEEFEIPRKLIRMVKATMENSMCKVRVQNELSESFETTNGLRQGDSLSCLLFNLALEKVIRDAGIQTRGTIFYRSQQLLAYADDIDIIGRTKNDIQKTFIAIKNSGEKMGLIINEEKTKYMIANPRCDTDSVSHISIMNFKFERVKSFCYLGSLVSDSNDMKNEITKRIQNANRCYYGLLKYFKSRLLTHNTKIRLYKTLVKPVLMYGSETWVLTKTDILKLHIFERKILRKIYGPINDNGTWRLRYNAELYQLYKSPDIVASIRISRLRWAGHIQRMTTEDIVKRVVESKLQRTRRVGRPNLRWIDGVLEDVKKLGIKNWWKVAKDRQVWRKILREAEAHVGL